MNKKISRLLKGALAVSMTLSSLMVSSVSNRVSAAEKEESYTQYVYNFMGTQGDHGIQFPGSVVPEGIVKLSPDTNPRTRAGYDYSASKILGFSHTRIEGVGGGGAGGDVLVTPTYVDYTKRPDKGSREQQFAKVDGKKVEEAHPGYYTTEIVPNTGKDGSYQSNTSMGNIKAEVTTDVRTGMHNYTFPEAGNVNLLVDMSNNYHGRNDATLNVVKNADNTVELSGMFKGRSVCDGSYTMYFYMEVNKPVTDVTTWENTNSTLGYKTSLQGTDIGAVLNFDVEKGETLQAKVSISPISEKQAKIDMHNEVPHWDFDKVRTHADDLWNETLGKVRIESSEKSDPDGRLKRLFYTNLYHMFLTPVNATSTDGKWRGNDMKLYEANDYTHYDSWTFWDDYRKYSIIGLVNPDFYRDVAKSTVDMMVTGYSDTGLSNQPVLTVRNEYAVTVIADAINKGLDVRDINNIEAAYEEAKKAADKHMDRKGTIEYGFIDGSIHDTATACFEYWGVANLAKALGKDDEAKEFAQKAMGYKNMFRKDAPTEQYLGEQIGILWPKHTPNVSGGSWLNCTPDRWQDCGMGQGTLWQYMWYDGYDMNGYVEMMGGKDNALKVLTYIFGEQDPDNGRAFLHSNVNEIDPQLPYLFNYVGKPSKTQRWARQVFSKKVWNRYRGDGEFNPPLFDYVYKLEPEGFLTSMDDDCGTMSSMYVSAAMGLFPVTPGDTTFQIGSPFFEKMTLDLGNGKTFTVEANNVSEDNFYIQSATINGKELNRSWLDYSEITRGGVLSFEMGSEPSTWAEDGVTPPSLSDVVTTDIAGDDLVYSGATFKETAANDGSIENTVELKVKNNEFVGNIGDDLAANGQIKITNVPAGLTASATKTAADKVEISLAGKAVNNTFDDSISNLTIEVTDAATTGTVTSNRKIKDTARVTFNDNGLVYSTTMIGEDGADDGSFTETATITLTGNATFAGVDGEDFVAAGKVRVANVPEGLTAVITRTSANTAEVSFAGNAVEHTDDKYVNIEFLDSAFDGSRVVDINNIILSGLSPFTLDFYKSAKTSLEQLVAEVEAMDLSVYTKKTAKAVTTALGEAKALLASEATDEELTAAYDKLFNAVDQLKINIVTDPTIIDNEEFVVKSDNENPQNGSEGPIEYAFDGDLSTFWHTQWQGGKKDLPTTVTIDMAKAYEIGQFTYVPRPGGGNGNITSYELYGKLNESDEYTLLSSGTWTDNGDTKVINFNKTEARYLKFVAKDGHGGYASAAEFYVHTPDEKADLRAALTEAREINQELYIEESYAVLEAAIAKAKAVIAKMDATLDEINEATEALRDAMENLVTIKQPVTIRLEAEEFDEGPGIAREGDHTGNNENGEWVKFNQVNFDEAVFNQLKVRYAGNTGNCAPDARIEVRIDDRETGELVAKMDTHPTGTWGDYVLVVDEILRPDLLKGTHDVYITFLGSSGKWIANYDYYEFVSVETKTHIEAEDRDDWSAGELKVEGSTDSEGNSLTNIGGARSNAWLRYNGVKFNGTGLTEFKLRYSHNPGSAGKNSYADIYLDDMDGQPVARIDLPTTGAWANYTVVSTLTTEKISGEHDVYLKLHTEGGKWVANFDWLEVDVNYDVVEADKAALQALYDQYKDTVNDHYTEASWAEFVGALDNAAAVLADEKASQEDVDNAVVALQEAFDGLVKAEAPVTDKTALQIAVEMAETVDTTNVIPTVKAEFVAALAEAKAILVDEYATQVQIDASFVRLATAIHMLEFVKGDKAELEALIKAAKEYNAEDYTKATWNNLQTVIAEAEAVVANEDAMQEEIDEMVAKLQGAIDGLVKLVDKSKLANLVEKVSGLDETKYLADSWAKFADALAKAEAILAAEEPTQAEVDVAYNELIRGYLSLRLVPNKDALEGLVKEAEALNKPALANAIADAKAVLANGNATEEEIAVAYNTLNSAVTNLTVNAGDKAPSVATGDSVNMIMPMAGLLAAGYVLTRKKED